MNIRIIQFLTIFLFLSVCMSAQDRKPVISAPISTKSVTYFDGKNQLTIYLLEGYIAEIGVQSEKNSRIKSIDSGASPIRNIGNAQIFKVGDASLLNNGRVSSKSQTAGKFSAVYSRSGDEGSFVLPVGLIVSYKINTTDSSITELEKKYSLKNGKKLPMGDLKFYTYETEAGQASLDLASTIRLESSVDSTAVDFIEERSLR